MRIVPFLMVCYFIAFVDRVNAGSAALHMNRDIGLTAAAFGLASLRACARCRVRSSMQNRVPESTTPHC